MTVEANELSVAVMQNSKHLSAEANLRQNFAHRNLTFIYSILKRVPKIQVLSEIQESPCKDTRTSMQRYRNLHAKIQVLSEVGKRTSMRP